MRTKFFTGRGDDGRSRVGRREAEKHNAYLVVLGMIDEANASIGLARTEAQRVFPAHRTGEIVVSHELLDFQQALFTVQAEIAALAFGSPPGVVPRVTESRTASLESLIERIDGVVPKLTAFVVPGGTELSARLEVARTVVRRAERGLSVLASRASVHQPILSFVNRLSSALFALARYANHVANVSEEHPHYG